MSNHDTSSYEDLVFRLRQDLQPDLATDILPYSRAAQPPWRTLPLVVANGWDGFAAFYVDTTRRLWVTGRLTGGTSGTVAFNLPSGSRPGTDIDIFRPIFDSYMTGQAAISFSANGDATITFTGMGVSNPLDLHIAVSYRVEQ